MQKAWMTAHLYQEWIMQWDHELRTKGRQILLLQDNFSGHIPPDDLQNIQVENFEPNLMAHIQPKDQGIIRCFKAHYRAKFIQQAVNRYNEGITPAEICDIDQLQAMRLADLAWREVNTTTIRNCWRKAGILPDIDNPTASTIPSIPVSSLLHDSPSEMDPVAHAEKQVEVALDDLVATGALQKSNQMDLESLLNPAGESHVLMEGSDHEIYQSVMDAIDVCENIEINGGDDIDDENDISHELPSRRDILKAVSMIGRYTDNMNDPVARKMEAILGAFTRQLRLDETRAMKNSVLTDFFNRT